jgi:hypothetical protein
MSMMKKHSEPRPHTTPTIQLTRAALRHVRGGTGEDPSAREVVDQVFKTFG